MATTTKNQVFEFTLILSGVDDVTEDLANALFEAGCDDALFGMQNGEAYLDFGREAKTAMDAIVSAIQDANKAGVKVLEARVPNMNEAAAVNSILKAKGSGGRVDALKSLL